MKTVTLICGIPNAGKTTFALKHCNNVIHSDYIEGHSLLEKFHKTIQLASSSETDVCVEGNFCFRKSRIELIKKFKDWKKVCIWIDTPLEICLDRSNSGGRSEYTVNYINNIFETPSKDEGLDEFYIINQ